MKHVVDPTHGVDHAAVVAHVADVDTSAVAAIELAMSSCFFSSRLKIRISPMFECEERAQGGVAERAGSAGDQQNLALEHSLAIMTADASCKRKDPGDTRWSSAYPGGGGNPFADRDGRHPLDTGCYGSN